MIIRGETEQMEVALDTDRKEIIVTQRWFLNFIDEMDSSWLPAEKCAYRQKMLGYIQMRWDNKAHAIVNSKRGSAFNRKYGHVPFPIRVKIKLNDYNRHWTVNIYKRKIRANVEWHARTISLESNSIYEKGKRAYCTVAYEFGHAFGNTRSMGDLCAGDEYYNNHPTFMDKASIMNYGCEVRHRHFSHVRDILQKMLPSSYFCIRLS